MKKPATIFLTLSLWCLLTPLNSRSDAGANPPAPRYAITDLGALDSRHSRTTGMNGKGQVVGDAILADPKSASGTVQHPVLWRDGKMVDLGVFVGAEETLPRASIVEAKLLVLQLIGVQGNCSVIAPCCGSTASGHHSRPNRTWAAAPPALITLAKSWVIRMSRAIMHTDSLLMLSSGNMAR